MERNVYAVQRWNGNIWLTIATNTTGGPAMETASIQYARGFADSIKRFYGTSVRIVRRDGARYVPLGEVE